jgi:hypothetical protein
MCKHIPPLLAAFLLSLVAYFAMYYAMVVRWYSDGGAWSWTWHPRYRIMALYDFFRPAHYLDRKIRPSYWHEERPITAVPRSWKLGEGANRPAWR